MVEETVIPPTDAESIRRRACAGSQHPRRFESLVALLWRAVAGTALAGFAFPSVSSVIAIFTGMYSFGQSIAALMGAVVLIGIPTGFLAFIVCMPVALFASVIGRLIGVTERDVWFASLVGGWTGFFVCQLVSDRMSAGAAFAMIAVAVATGQIGAGAYAYRGFRQSSGADRPDEVRFGLRQLFGVMTAVALLAILARALTERGAFMAQSAMMAVGIQAAIIGLGVAVSIYARRRRAAAAVSREAAQLPALAVATTAVARGTPIESSTRSG